MPCKQDIFVIHSCMFIAILKNIHVYTMIIKLNDTVHFFMLFRNATLRNLFMAIGLPSFYIILIY